MRRLKQALYLSLVYTVNYFYVVPVLQNYVT